ncbi:MAG: T9SS type A sorting domain-containing protein [Bacteroidetes bacterium]|nr:T9SS type A sorting domain-containing protein [Bacteroidota bacterium]
MKNLSKAALISFLFFVLIANAQIRNVRVDTPGGGGNFQPCEVSITANPANPEIVAAGAVLSFFYLSTDGGNTWSQSLMESNLGVWGDPALAFDKVGNLYYSHLSNPPSGVGHWIDRIVVQKSTDNGTNWDEGVGLNYTPPEKEQDKEWITVDLTNTTSMNDVYVSWTEFDDYGSNDPEDSSKIYFAAFDKSFNKWSTPIRINDVSGNCLDGDDTVEGAVPAAGGNNTVYVSWAGPEGIVFDRSFDGGATWGNDIFVVDQVGGWDMSVSGVGRCNGMPITCCDISNTSPYGGNIYINWADQRNGEENPDIFLIKSTDEGDTWGDVVKVNNDNTTRAQFFPWMSVDPVTGFIYVVFYDRRNTTGKVTEVYLARSKDGGDTFENFLISESSFDFPNGFSTFFGDYNNITSYNGKIFPMWTRVNDDGNTLSVWTAPIDDSELIVSTEKEYVVTDYKLLQNYPNPFNPSTTISYQLPEKSHVTLKVFDTIGQEVATLLNEEVPAGVHEVNFDATHLATGTYVYKIYAGDFHDTGKMVLLK